MEYVYLIDHHITFLVGVVPEPAGRSVGIAMTLAISEGAESVRASAGKEGK